MAVEKAFLCFVKLVFCNGIYVSLPVMFGPVSHSFQISDVRGKIGFLSEFYGAEQMGICCCLSDVCNLFLELFRVLNWWCSYGNVFIKNLPENSPVRGDYPFCGF